MTTAKSLRACVEYTYRQDKKASLEHLHAYRGLPISFHRKTVETMKRCAARQNKARYKKPQPCEDDVGLKGENENWVNYFTVMKFFISICFSLYPGPVPRKTQKRARNQENDGINSKKFT